MTLDTARRVVELAEAADAHVVTLIRLIERETYRPADVLPDIRVDLSRVLHWAMAELGALEHARISQNVGRDVAEGIVM